jgi:hypothetical protein
MRGDGRRPLLLRCAVAIGLVLAVAAACSDGIVDDPAGGQITVPPFGESPPGDPPEPVEPETVALDQSWYGRPSGEAIESIEALGIVVADFFVCSGSVARGEVRQITRGDGVILDDRDGLTEASQEIEAGSVVQMKIGNGTPCN